MKKLTSLSGKIVKLKEIPEAFLKRKRHVVPKAFQILADWPAAEAAMEKDHIGVGEGFVIAVPQELIDEHDLKSIKQVARPIKLYIKKRYKKKYHVKAFISHEGPTIIISQGAIV